MRAVSQRLSERLFGGGGGKPRRIRVACAPHVDHDSCFRVREVTADEEPDLRSWVQCSGHCEFDGDHRVTGRTYTELKLASLRKRSLRPRTHEYSEVWTIQCVMKSGILLLVGVLLPLSRALGPSALATWRLSTNCSLWIAIPRILVFPVPR